MSTIIASLRRRWYRLSPRTRDTVQRAAKTFAQAFIGVAVPAVLAAPALSVAVLVTIVSAAVASAASLVWNTVLKPAIGPVTVVIPMPEVPSKPGNI